MVELYTVAAAAILTYICVLYVYANLIKDASIIDIAWGLGFAALAIGLAFYYTEHTQVKYLVAGLVTVWGLRLGLHIGLRKRGKPEDWRYLQWRKTWGKYYNVRSFLQIFILQGLLLLIISAPVVVASNVRTVTSLSTFQWIGVVIFGLGLVYEVVADWQLTEFSKIKKKDQILQTGLWKYSRHPNYFGEVILWWGLWLVVLPLAHGGLAVVSPVAITFLILFVSGVPVLEKKFKKIPAFKAYAKKTSVFIPLPPRKS